MSSRTSTRTPVRGRGRVVKRRARGGTSGRRKGSRVVTATAVPEELVNQESDESRMAGVSSETSSVPDEMVDILTEGQRQASSRSVGEDTQAALYSLANRVKTEKTNGVKIPSTTLKLLSKALLLLFDPTRGFVLLKDHVVALIGSFGNPLEEKDIPPIVKSHVAQLKRNLTEAKNTVQRMERSIAELLQLIGSYLKPDVAKEELKGIKFKLKMVNSDLDVCKLYVSKAQAELLEVEMAVGVNILLRLIGTVGLMCAADSSCLKPSLEFQVNTKHLHA